MAGRLVPEVVPAGRLAVADVAAPVHHRVAAVVADLAGHPVAVAVADHRDVAVFADLPDHPVVVVVADPLHLRFVAPAVAVAVVVVVDVRRLAFAVAADADLSPVVAVLIHFPVAVAAVSRFVLAGWIFVHPPVSDRLYVADRVLNAVAVAGPVVVALAEAVGQFHHPNIFSFFLLSRASSN